LAAPTFGFSASNGATPTVTDAITSIVFASLDSNIITTPTLQTANPITVGNNSFETWIRMKVTGVASNSLSAFGVYFSATAPTDNGGVSTYITMKFATNGTYATPTASASTVATTLCSTATSAPGTSFTAPANTVGSYSGYVTQQMLTTSSATGGNTTFASPWCSFAYTYS
jgi:hypothetical protein